MTLAFNYFKNGLALEVVNNSTSGIYPTPCLNLGYVRTTKTATTDKGLVQ
jgi:hypothetical protein